MSLAGGALVGESEMSSSYTYKRLDKDDAVVLMVDHQSGLISLVQDYTPNEFKNNVLALADVAKFFKLPTVLTTSFEEGPNGPIVPELKAAFPDAAYIPRPGQINAWDNEDFVATRRTTATWRRRCRTGRPVNRCGGHRHASAATPPVATHAATAACCCGQACEIHDHAATGSVPVAAGDLEAFWGSLGCSCRAI